MPRATPRTLDSRHEEEVAVSDIAPSACTMVSEGVAGSYKIVILRGLFFS
jgi:hypothetical protein